MLIYGLPTEIKERGLLDPVWGQGNHLYRVHYDGQQMDLIEDVAETTGIGLGVHTVIYPDASGFAAADGQKDVAAFFDRPPLPTLAKDDVAVSELNKGQKTKVQMAFGADWIGREADGSMEANWFNGGKLRLTRLVKARETGLYDLRGTKGNKIDWEMVPMAEYLVYTGQLPGDAPRKLCGLDAVVHHPGNRYSAMVIRMCSAAVIVDRTNWEPVCCLHMPEGSPGNLPIKKVSSNPDTWEVEFQDLKCVGHEAGFSPDGKFFTMMNNIRQNNMPVFDTSDPDPRNWKKFTFVKDPAWVGDYPSPFHLCFSMDRSQDVRLGAVAQAGQERRRRGRHQDVADHQEVRECRPGPADHGGDLRRQVRAADLLGLPAAGIGRVRVHPGYAGAGRLPAQLRRPSRLRRGTDENRAPAEQPLHDLVGGDA